jgi:hypothetical protein
MTAGEGGATLELFGQGSEQALHIVFGFGERAALWRAPDGPAPGVPNMRIGEPGHITRTDESRPAFVPDAAATS